MDSLEQMMVDFGDKISAPEEAKPEWYHRLASAVAAASAPYALRLIPKFRKLPISIPQTLATAAIGATIPDLLAESINAKRRGEANRFIDPFINKEAGLYDKAVHYAWSGVKDIGRGLKMPVFKKDMKASDRALSVASKGAAAYALYRGGKYLGKKSWDPDYTNAMRNNILAGNINPNELSESDMQRVMKLGV